MAAGVANLVTQKRLKLGVSQEVFAVMLGLQKKVELVNKWETEQVSPTAAQTTKILNLEDKVPFKNTFDENDPPKFSFIDLFAGIGGIRLPFQQAGGQCVFTSEWDKFAQIVYATNFGEAPYGDITKIENHEIPAHDLLLAGFPCQAFSQAGRKKGFYDTRGTLFFEIQRILAFHQPKAFVLENVKQLAGHDSGRTLKIILSVLSGENSDGMISQLPEELRSAGLFNGNLNYEVEFKILRARDFGVPQNRERIFIIGLNKSYFPQGTVHSVFEDLDRHKRKTTLGDVLEPNSTVDPSFTISDKLLAGHKRRRISHKLKGNGFGYSVFDHQSEYCNTISARYYKDGSEILIDQSALGLNPRKLTPRECARIQGFPENYIVNAVSKVQTYKQFGNSVSVPVLQAIANELSNRLINLKIGSSKY